MWRVLSIQRFIDWDLSQGDQESRTAIKDACLDVAMPKSQTAAVITVAENRCRKSENHPHLGVDVAPLGSGIQCLNRAKTVTPPMEYPN
jgi:hypothetical protein